MSGLREILIAAVVILVGALLWPVRRRMWEKHPPQPWMFWAIIAMVVATVIFCVYTQYLR